MLPLPAAGEGAAQPPAPEASSPGRLLADASRAWREGRYGDVVRFTESLTGSMPAAALLRARALRATGEYADAERQLVRLANREPGGEAALELADLLASVGRKADARRRYEALLAKTGRADAADLARAARAAWGLGRYEEANTLFRDAAARAGDDPELQTAWGTLFLEKQNAPEAIRSFRAALQSDRRWVPGYVGIAQAFKENNGAAARELAGRALTMNPSYVPAHVLLADLALDERQYDEARAAIAGALEVNPRSLDALALRAALAWLEDRRDDFERDVKAALAVHPSFGEIYRVAGSHAARHYRFAEAADLVRRGLALDPSDARASADLGIHLLRTGDEADARKALDRAFAADPYDVVTYNLLGLLDTLDRFETIEDGPLVLKLHPDEAPVLREHALPLAREALRALSERYRFTPQGPILIEIFPRHDDFAVRNVGLPGMIGALGACFGRVITLDSPRARPPGSFNWQSTLWHEMAHVITLQMSKQRVPRWLTEGVSVFEEQRARPEWGREMELRFAEALRTDRVLKLADLNAGFMNPETISLAYYQASLLVEHIVQSHGEPALHALLRAYGEGLDTDAAVGQALGVTMEALQTTFTAALDRRFAPILAALTGPDEAISPRTRLPVLRELAAAHPDSYEVHLRLGQALGAAGEYAAAVAALERASALLPAASGAEGPQAAIAELAEARGDLPRAIAALESVLARDDSNLDAARRLASLVDPVMDPARAARAYTRIAELDPFDSAAHAFLGRRALAQGDAETASRWFRVALAAGPADRAAAHCDLAESYLKGGTPDLAKRQTLAALEVAPTYARAQDLLLTIVEGQP